jgi:hypothetical protein
MPAMLSLVTHKGKRRVPSQEVTLRSLLTKVGISINMHRCVNKYETNMLATVITRRKRLAIDASHFMLLGMSGVMYHTVDA